MAEDAAAAGEFALAVGTYGGHILSYKVQGSTLKPFFGGTLHNGAVRFIGWQGGEQLISGASDESMRVINCASGSVETHIVGGRGCLFAARQQLTINNQIVSTLVTVTVDGSVLVYHRNIPDPVFQTTFCQRSASTGKPVACDLARVVCHPHVKGLFAVLYLDGSVWLWNIEKKHELARLHDLKRGVSSSSILSRATDIAWSSDGEYLFTLFKAELRATRLADGVIASVTPPEVGLYSSIATAGDMICAGLSSGKLILYKLLCSEPDAAPEENELTDQQIEPWLELTIPRGTRVRSIKALELEAGFRILATCDGGRVALFEVSGEGSVEYSELMDAPYSITCIDAKNYGVGST